MSEAQLQTLWANGAKAWADVPNASQWVEEVRGNVEEKRMSDTPRTDACEVRFSTLFAGEDAMWVPSKKAKEIERELNAANERIKQLERDLYVASEKIKRLESWNTQNCHDKANLIETLRYRDERIKQLEKAGDATAVWCADEVSLEQWNNAKQ